MSLLQTISDFLESIFKRSSPEVQRKQLLKKIDAEIREFNPSICKGGMLQANFGEAILALYKNARPLDNLFSVTVSPNDIPRQHRFEAQLISTGYSTEEQKILDSLSYVNRKAEIQAEFQNAERLYLHQKNQNEKNLKVDEILKTYINEGEKDRGGFSKYFGNNNEWIIDENKKIVLEYVSIRYNEITKEIEDYDIDGYILEK